MSFSAHKQLKFYAQKSNGTPGAEQLALINQFTLKDMTADEVYTRTVILAHNAIDRDSEVFDESLLSAFANSLPGKGLFNKHPMSYDGDTGPGIGRWYNATVIDMSLDEARALTHENLQFPPGTERAKLLQADYYMVRTDSAKDFIANVDGGVVSDVSIGFRASQRTDITDAQGNVIARRLHAPGEALEGSLVWLGAQPGARTIKHFNPEQQTEEHPMAMTPDEQKALNDAQAEAKANAAKVTEFEPKAKAYDALKAALGDDLQDHEIVELVKQSKDIRGKMIDDIIRAKRLKGQIKDNDTAAMDNYKAFYGKAPFSVLESDHAEFSKSLPGSDGQLNSGDPNATGADPNAGNKDASSPFGNVMIAG